MSTFDARAHLHGVTVRAHQMFVKDLNALTEENASKCPGGVARPAIEVVVECAGLNGSIAGLLTTGEFNRPTPEQRKAYYATITTREAALAELEQKTQILLAAIDTMDENTMGEMLPGIFGSPMTRFALAEVPFMHMMYHDGQLNYIQCLNGDSEIHW